MGNKNQQDQATEAGGGLNMNTQETTSSATEGMYVDAGVLTVKDGSMYRSYTREFIIETMDSFQRIRNEYEKMRDDIRRFEPGDIIKQLVTTLDAKADECSKQKWLGQEMAYRDAAGTLRKALKNE